MIIAFDFDNTIARSTAYHRRGWENVLSELKLGLSLDDLLPYEPNLKERFDSYRRIEEGFLTNPKLVNKISAYFKNANKKLLAKKLMSLKESFAISGIFSECLSDSLKTLATNFIPAVDLMKRNGFKLWVITSSRETIVSSLLQKCNLLDAFSLIAGEELMTDSHGVLFDKPDPYITKKLKGKMDYYIGDNDNIDKEFAHNCHAEFILADYKTDFLDLVNKLK